jgi:PKD repeat protein
MKRFISLPAHGLSGRITPSAGLLLFLILAGLSISRAGVAQTVFQGRPQEANAVQPIPELPEFQVYALDLVALGMAARGLAAPATLTLELGDILLRVTLEPLPSIRPDARVTILRESGPEPAQPRESSAYRVRFPEGEGRWVLHEEFLAGGFTWGDKTYMIEPLWYYLPDSDPRLVVLYERDIVQVVAPWRCGNEHLHPVLPFDMEPGPAEDSDARAAGCREVEYAWASDWLFFQKYGSESAVMDRIETILSLVEWQFTGWFNDNYLYPVTGYLISACSSCDPAEWSNTNDPYELLTNFRNWAESGGFGNTVYDVAGLWTDRVFNNSIIGIAYLSAVCTDNRYHAIMDFTPNTSLMRVLVAHELGHNFSSDHDAAGSNFIMTPNVNSTTIWSSQSINAVNAFAGNSWCLDPCSQNAPPVASFSASPEEGCPPLIVQFSDLSVNNPTTWQWTFPGGDPYTSVLQNPLIAYTTPGVFPVTLAVSNSGGSHSITVDEAVRVIIAPVANFTFQVNQRSVSFFPDAPGATSYHWDFGDGNSSSLQYPLHTYADDGQFVVTLTASNNCGDGMVSTTVVVITVPLAGFSGTPREGCLPLQVAFTDASTPNTTHWNWQFPGGNPASSLEANPVVTYAEPGLFTVSLTVSNAAGGHTHTETNYIAIGAPPSAGYVYTISRDTVFFQAGGGPDSLLWEFGDGQSSTTLNPVHIYAQEGVYDVRLTVWNECGEDTYTELLEILLPPIADFEALPAGGCPSLDVQFMQKASANTASWQWYFPGGQPAQSAEADPLVQYTLPGTYDVTLIVTNAAGTDTLLRSGFIAVFADPVAGWSAVQQNGNTLVFTNESQFAQTYRWDFGDGATSQESDPVHVYPQAGTYTVTLIASNPCAGDTLQAQVSVELPPQAHFSANPSSGCSPLTVVFTDLSQPEASAWTWTLPGGDPDHTVVQHPVVSYLQPGLYDVALTVANPQGWHTTLEKSGFIRVITSPQAAFMALNQQGSVAFTNLSLYSEAFEWHFGDGETSTEEHPSHSYAQEGPYVVTLTVSNPCGTHIFSQVIEVIFPPRAGFTADPLMACADSMEVQFQELITGQTEHWQWTFEGGMPTESDLPDPLVRYLQPGRFAVRLIAAGPGGADTLERQHYIDLAHEAPLAGFSYIPDGLEVNFSSQAEGASAWQWDFGDGVFSNEEDPVHGYAAGGIFTVTLVVANPCGKDTVIQEIQVGTSVTKALGEEWSIRVYPNPSSGTYQLLMPAGFWTLEVRDVLSRRVMDIIRLELAPGQPYILDMGSLPDGIYVLLAGKGKEILPLPLILRR